MTPEITFYLEDEQQEQLHPLEMQALAANEAGEKGMILAQLGGEFARAVFIGHDKARLILKILNPQAKTLQQPHPKTSIERFFALLDRVPRLLSLWDREAKELRVDAFDNALPVLSTGEYLMAKFFAAVWFGNGGRYAFDVVEAMSHLDEKNQQIILDWVADPFYP